MCWRETRGREKERANETTDDEMRDIGVSVILAVSKLPEQLMLLQRERNNSDVNTEPLQCINIGRNNDGACFHHANMSCVPKLSLLSNRFTTPVNGQ